MNFSSEKYDTFEKMKNNRGLQSSEASARTATESKRKEYSKADEEARMVPNHADLSTRDNVTGTILTSADTGVPRVFSKKEYGKLTVIEDYTGMLLDFFLTESRKKGFVGADAMIVRFKAYTGTGSLFVRYFMLYT